MHKSQQRKTYDVAPESYSSSIIEITYILIAGHTKQYDTIIIKLIILVVAIVLMI